MVFSTYKIAVAAFVVELGRRYRTVAQPIAYLGDVGTVLQSVGRRRGPQTVRTDGFFWDARDLGVMLDHVLVDGVPGEGSFQASCRIPDRAEQGAFSVLLENNYSSGSQ